MDKEELLALLDENGFYYGMMISGSKSGYHKMFPKNLVAFNANIFVENHGKIWYGDIDLTKSYEKLKEISEISGMHLYVLREMDGRFGNEDNPNFKNISVWNTEHGLSDTLKSYYSEKNLELIND